MPYKIYHHFSYFSTNDIVYANINILYFACLVKSSKKKKKMLCLRLNV